MNLASSSQKVAARWTPEILNAARQTGDEAADTIAAQLFQPPSEGDQHGGRPGYNMLVDVADHLINDAELLLVDKSRLATWLRQVPEPLRTYYSPMPAPDWIDTEKLEM